MGCAGSTPQELAPQETVLFQPQAQPGLPGQKQRQGGELQRLREEITRLRLARRGVRLVRARAREEQHLVAGAKLLEALVGELLGHALLAHLPALLSPPCEMLLACLLYFACFLLLFLLLLPPFLPLVLLDVAETDLIDPCFNDFTRLA